ncbi:MULTISPECIES: FAD assembly factor SdhE [unclassified Francisella]|uniref:FAD assembly factor SdhE n=1 Tax=unclassified Francisella TaxID=2610885 RepID=UPI002E33C2A2|nr:MULTISPECIES: succinate dehydrogenase assembly factor 2 [unclassified Francisella]MED7819096.1 succinate dehydrogenase assembly factor 2 [Francisella sp. 19S2-4]MED7829944.1 succinate dehydrogenase assembly factor 2 [Francisella sp. 19S2-10]
MLIKNNDLIFSSSEKIKYSARRGMLELDIILAPYLNNCYMKEDLKNKKLFVEFLTSEDSDMFDWLFKGVEAPQKYQELIQKIVNEKKKFNKDNLK